MNWLQEVSGAVAASLLAHFIVYSLVLGAVIGMPALWILRLWLRRRHQPPAPYVAPWDRPEDPRLLRLRKLPPTLVPPTDAQIARLRLSDPDVTDCADPGADIVALLTERERNLTTPPNHAP